MANRVQRTEEELRYQYAIQFKMLQKRCDAFYDGDRFEARDIATILRKLLYDHGQSKSVLQQLDMKENLQCLDSRALGNLSLASTQAAWPRTVIPFRPYTDENMVPFDIWWRGQEFHVLYKNIVFTRKELVLTIANQDGGAHVDPTIDERIAILGRKKSPWNVMYDDKEPIGLYEWELASMCAIGEELIYSLMPEDKRNKRINI